MSNGSELNIDIVEIFKYLYVRKIFIVSVTLIFSVFSVVYSLSLPNKYTSTTLLNINDQESQSSSMLDQYSGLASIAGISIPTSGADSKAFRAVSIMKSKDFLKGLIEYDSRILPSIMASESYDQDSQELIFDSTQYDVNENKWIREAIYPYSVTPTYIEAHEHYLGLIETEIDQETNYIEVSVTHISPHFAHTLLELIINRTNQRAKNEDLKDAENALNYLTEEDEKSSVLSLKKSINNLKESQMKIKMVANISDDYLLKTIDSPYVPLKKSSPFRALICIIGFFLGIFISVSYLIVTFYQKDN